MAADIVASFTTCSDAKTRTGLWEVAHRRCVWQYARRGDGIVLRVRVEILLRAKRAEKFGGCRPTPTFHI